MVEFVKDNIKNNLQEYKRIMSQYLFIFIKLQYSFDSIDEREELIE